jgi:hypothetical protein
MSLQVLFLIKITILHEGQRKLLPPMMQNHARKQLAFKFTGLSCFYKYL